MSSVTAAPVDPAFSDTVVLSGFTNPTAVEFASDGRVFVAEKSGIVKVFDSLSDPTPTTFADLRTNVHNFWDRGLLGMALHPNFPTDPRVYVLYTYDAAIGQAAPRWGSVGGTSDGCPNPPGATADGCVVSGRLSVLTANGDVSTGESVLINDWCQQYPSHSVGDLRFGQDGALYVTGGDGASFNFSDYGQDGNPVNPCGDPSNRPDGAMVVPTAEGGALRSQDIRTTGDPVSLDGSLLRIDPNTGAAMAGNPLIGNADLNARRIVAHGFRNPFRLTVRPGTNEVWVADVGNGAWEEINRIANPTAPAPITNRGWPCIEGASLHPGSFGDLNLCQSLYSAGTAAAPYFAYAHGQPVAGETCSTGSGSSISGIAFYEGGPYPAQYDNALFFADYSRNCIWVMRAGSNGLPDPATTAPFIQNAAAPVQLKVGPNGDLFYPDFTNGTIHRVSYQATGSPTAVASATPSSGTAPLTVNFSSSGSSDPEQGPLAYAWDLDGDGAFDDSTAANPTFTYATPATITAALRVTDAQSLTDTDQVTVTILGSGGTQYVSDLPFVSSTNGWGPVERDRSNGEIGGADGAVITLNGVTYTKGLGAHAASDVQIAVPSGCTTFGATIGVDDEVGSAGSVTFQVVGDSTSLFTSQTLTGASAGQPISVDITGRSQLRLVVAGGADIDHDHADWANARLTCGSGGGNAAPAPTIAAPTASFTWHVGETVDFSGGATDAEDGTLPATALHWDLLLHHCDIGCHVHALQSWDGVASASFDAPDHEYPSHLELLLTATDSGGRVSTVSTVLQPETVDLSFATSPSGLQVTVGSTTQAAPFTRTMIVGSKSTISSPTPQASGTTSYAFSSWSDGGPRNHDIIAGALPTTYTATFTAEAGTTIRHVSDLPFVSSTNGWGPVERDRSNGENVGGDGNPITLNGQAFTKGLGVHAASDVRVAIPAGCTSFAAVIGVDDEVGSLGSVTFQVLGGTTSLFTSPTLTGTQAGQAISVNLGTATELRLLVSGGADINSDHADWADARLICGTVTNTPPTLAQPADQASQEGAVASLQLQGSDIDADPLSYTATGLPAGLSVNTSTGLISGTVAAGAAAASPYSVAATVSDGRGGTNSKTFSWSISVPTPPSAPTNLVATPTTEDTRLAWTAPGGAAPSGYNIYRAASSAGPFTKLNASPITARTYTDSSAPPMATGWYRVTAVGPTGLESSPTSVSADRRIQLVNTTTATNAGTATLQISVPSGRQANDLLLATVTVAGGQTVTAPAGWTLVRSDASASALRQAVFYRVAAGSEPASYTFSLSGARTAGGGMALYRGVSTTTPIEANSGRIGGSGTQVITSPVTTLTPNAAVVAIFAAAWNTTVVPPSTMLDQAGVSFQRSTQRLAFRLADRVQPTPGGSGTLNATLGRSAANIGQLYVLRPASP